MLYKLCLLSSLLRLNVLPQKKFRKQFDQVLTLEKSHQTSNKAIEPYSLAGSSQIEKDGTGFLNHEVTPNAFVLAK